MPMKQFIAVLAGLTFLLTPPAAAFDPRPATAHAALGTTEVLFSPHDDIEAAILRVLRGARHSVHVQAYLFTSRSLGAALIEAKARGLHVEVLADRRSTPGLDAILRAVHRVVPWKAWQVPGEER